MNVIQIFSQKVYHLKPNKQYLTKLLWEWPTQLQPTEISQFEYTD